MAIQQISLESLQFAPDEDPTPKLRRLQEQIRSLQQALNTVIAELNAAHVTKEALEAETTELAEGEWDVTVVDGSPHVFQVRYNAGGSVVTGFLTLS